jgi:carboxyl-terminal processing protease
MTSRQIQPLNVLLLMIALLASGLFCPAYPGTHLLAQEPPVEGTKKGQKKQDPKDQEKQKSDEADKSEQDKEYFELLRLFVDTLDQIDRNYVEDVSRRELLEAAIEGMVDKLDQYSNYISPTEMDRFRSNVENEFGGIGIRVSSENGTFVIISPMYGTPAYKQGILAGDEILKIDGETTKGLVLDDVVKRLKGRIGASVTLTVKHPRDEEPRDITVKRELVRVQTVVGYRRDEMDDSWIYYVDDERRVAYIHLTSFGRHTLDELRQTMSQLKKDKFEALILDLRFNPGGLLSSAIEISDMFISSGRIVSTEGRNAPRNEWNAHKKGTYDGFPMVVVANRYSASASEIVSACLQDHDRATVVGERTWGKGSVQNIIQLEGGKSALKLTTAGYRRPSGTNIHRTKEAKPEDEWGVQPNDGQRVRFSDDEMKQLGQFRRDVDILHKNNPRAEDDPAPTFDDRQLNKAIELLVEQLEAGTTEASDDDPADDAGDAEESKKVDKKAAAGSRK